MFNQFFHHRKFCVHSWTVIINDICCYTLSLIRSCHNYYIVTFHGIEFKCIVNGWWSFLFYLNFHSWWPLVIYLFLSWHKVQKILKKLFIVENWILAINILIFSTLTLIFGGHRCLLCYFMRLNRLELLIILLLYEKQVWINKHYCDW